MTRGLLPQPTCEGGGCARTSLTSFLHLLTLPSSLAIACCAFCYAPLLARRLPRIPHRRAVLPVALHFCAAPFSPARGTRQTPRAGFNRPLCRFLIPITWPVTLCHLPMQRTCHCLPCLPTDRRKRRAAGGARGRASKRENNRRRRDMGSSGGQPRDGRKAERRDQWSQ